MNSKSFRASQSSLSSSSEPVPMGYNVFRRVISAAEHPHLSIPETEAGRNRKHYRQLINRSLMFVSVGAAVGIVGLAAYRVYAARKNA